MTDLLHHTMILSDFDGTFAGKNGRIVPENVEAIRHFQALGGLFTFSTGRLPSVLSQIYPDFRTLANAPLIMCNGALLYDPQTDTILQEYVFDGVKARSAVKDIWSRFPEMEFVVYTDDGIMRRNLPPDEVVGDRWRKMRFRGDSVERALACRDYVLSTYDNLFNCHRAWHTFTEVVGKSVTKGRMIAHLRQYFADRGLSDLRVFAVGDFENDVDMLRNADVACCPANAIDEVKALCSVYLCDHDEGAIADLIRRIETHSLS